MTDVMITADGPVSREKWLTDGCKEALAKGFAIVAQRTPHGLTYTPCSPSGVRAMRRMGNVSHIFWAKGADRSERPSWAKKHPVTVRKRRQKKV